MQIGIKKEYIALIFISFIAIAYFKKTLHVKRISVKRNKRNVMVDDTAIEYSDLRYYINTRKEFEKRKTMYNTIIDPEIYIETDIPVDIPDIIAYHIDNQNVHDNIVQKNIKNTYNGIHDFNENIDNIKEDIITFSKKDYKDKLTDIIEKIEKRNAHVTNVNSNEIDVLKNVWLNGDNNVKLQLVNELLDCVDAGNVLYCPTGVTSRLISATHINNPEFSPKSKDLLKREVLEKFGHNYTLTSDKVLSKERTINDYFAIYERKDIEDIINEWYEHID